MLRRQEALLEESRMRREKNHDTETADPSHGQPKKKRQPDPVEFISNESSSRTRYYNKIQFGRKQSRVSEGVTLSYQLGYMCVGFDDEYDNVFFCKF